MTFGNGIASLRSRWLLGVGVTINMKLEKILEEFGLGEKASRVYLAALELGSSSAQDIARKAELKRTTVYEILETLAHEGLVSTTSRGRSRIFIAERPRQLLRNLEDKQKKIADALPELESLYNAQTTKPRIRFYEGRKGIETVYEDTLTTKNKKLDAILSVRDILDVAGQRFLKDYVPRRVAAGIKLYVIRPEAKEVKDIWPHSSRELREVRLAPRGMDFGITQYLYNNKVAFISTKKEGFGMIIESDDFYQTQKNLFDVLWEVSRNTPRRD